METFGRIPWVLLGAALLGAYAMVCAMAFGPPDVSLGLVKLAGAVGAGLGGWMGWVITD